MRRWRPPLKRAPGLAAREQRRLVDKTERVAKGIGHVERTLTPRPLSDPTHWQAGVATGRRESAEAFGPSVDRFEVTDGKVQVFEVDRLRDMRS
jgi:hypothetical protein